MIGQIYGYNNGYSTYTPVTRHQSFTGMEYPELKVKDKPSEEEHRKSSAKLALWSLAVLAVPLVAYLVTSLVTHGKASSVTEKLTQKGATAAENLTRKSAGTAAGTSKGAGAAAQVKDFSKMTVEELKKMQGSAASVSDNMEIMKAIFEKSKGKDAIEAGENYIKYLDDIKNGKIKLDNEDFFERCLSNNNFSYINHEKWDIYGCMSDIYKSEKNYPKALEMSKKAGELWPGNESTVGEISKLHALNGNPDEGIRIAKQALEKIKNQVFNDMQVDLTDAIADCVKAKGNNDLYKTIMLLKKSNYHPDELTSEEIKYLIDKGIDPKSSLCGAHGREQTGLFAKWVLAQV